MSKRLTESQQEREYRKLMGDEAANRQIRAATASRCSCKLKNEGIGAIKGSHHADECAFYC